MQLTNRHRRVPKWTKADTLCASPPLALIPPPKPPLLVLSSCTLAQLDPRFLPGHPVVPVVPKPSLELHRRWGGDSSTAASTALLSLNTFSPRASTGFLKKAHTEEKNDLIQSWLNSMGRLLWNFNELWRGPWGWINIGAGRKVSRCSPCPGPASPRRLSPCGVCPAALRCAYCHGKESLCAA